MKKGIYILIVCLFALSWSAAGQTKDKFVVVIDAGHGGEDPGAIANRQKEKDINLAVALKLGKKIRQNCSDARVIYTRSKDVFVTLKERANIANKAKADLFISIHTNAAGNTSANGTETYVFTPDRGQAENREIAKRENSVIYLEDDYSTSYQGYDPNSPESGIILDFVQDKYMEQSIHFASLVQEQFRVLARRPDRSVRQANFLVLRQATMPRILVEVGYVTNPADAAYLAKDASRDKLAEAIYKAFVSYKDETLRKRQSGHSTSVAGNGTTAQTSSGVVYKIQLMASKKKLTGKAPEFKGLSPVSYYEENNMYKYTYGESTRREDMLAELPKVKRLFKDAFIVAFKNGVKVK